MRTLFVRIASLFAMLYTLSSLAISPPTITSGYTVDYDNYGVIIYGTNFDSSSYVDIRSTTGSAIILSVRPPNITYLPGSTTSALSFRINDSTVQNLLATQGLRFYVVSPTDNYQFAGPITIQRGSPSYSSQPTAFHTMYYRPAQGSFWAMLADDTGSPSPRQQAIWSINNNLHALRASGLDTVSVMLPDDDGWPSQHGGGFSYDPVNNPSPQRAVGEEIFLRIAAANGLKVIFVIAPNLYRESTDGRTAWNGLADQYDISPTSTGSLNYIHSLIDPTPYYGTPSTTELSTIGLVDGPIRQYFNDPRVVGFILAPELNPNVISSNGIRTHQYYFNKYWNFFYNLVHYNGSQTAFAGVYLIGSPPNGVNAQVALVKEFKSWFKSGSGNTMPDEIGIECYGGAGYPLQNAATDMNVIIDAMLSANTAQYPGDYAISSRKVFFAEGNTDEASNPYTNNFYNRMMLLVSKRVLGGIQWFASDTFTDGTPPTVNDAGWQLYNTSFTLTGTKVFTSTLPAGKYWHNLNAGGSYADPTTWTAYSDNLSAQWGRIAYTGPTPKGYWYGQAISDFVNGKSVAAYAYPNPAVGNASHLAATTIYWDATGMPSVSSVQIHQGSPSGTLIGSGTAAGNVTTSTNVPNGTIFYVQDVTNSKPLTLANTLSQIYVNVQ